MIDTRNLDSLLGRLDTFRELYDNGTKLKNQSEVEAVAGRLWDAEWEVDADIPGHASPIFLLREIARTATRVAEQLERAKEMEWDRIMELERLNSEGE